MADENGQEKGAFLTYLLSQESLSPEEAAETAVDLMMGAVETVRVLQDSTHTSRWFVVNLFIERIQNTFMKSKTDKYTSHNVSVLL